MSVEKATSQHADQDDMQRFDFVVVGGGLAGVCAAIAAARGGARTALIQDRPVLGGNSSSEVRVSVSGPGYRIPYAIETGIIHEIILEDRWRNHGRFWSGYINTIWDIVLYEWVTREPNLTLYLNTSVREVSCAPDGRITSVAAVQIGSERSLRFAADLFCDATGDGVVAHLAGARYRVGREARAEFDEPNAPEQADELVLPSTLLIRARDMGRPVPFRAPPWAAKYPDETVLFRRGHYDPENDMFLWLEIGSPFDTIADNEAIKSEILKHALGVWDHIKNYCTHKEQAANWALDWVGMVVGKRESRRIEGDYWLREQDVWNAARFPDAVAFGGWYVDHHNPRGINAGADEHWIAKGDTREVMVKPYAIPYRTMYAKTVENLFVAGRCMSATHMAFGSTRLMGTLAVCGQAVGTAAALCRKSGLLPRDVGQTRLHELQQQLMRDDCFLPGIQVNDPADLAASASIGASSAAGLSLTTGDKEHELAVGLAQSFPVSSDRIETVWLRLRSTLAKPVTVRLGLRAADNCWDFDKMEDIATATAQLPAGADTEIAFHLNAPVKKRGFYWVCVDALPGVFWSDARDIPIGCIPAWEVDFKPQYFFHDIPRFARAMRVAPEQRPFEPDNVLASPARPELWTNFWMSDPAQGMPQSLTLRWPQAVSCTAVEIIFDSNISREYRFMTPLSAAPELVRDYDIEAMVEGAWTTLVQATDNHMRHCRHRFERVRATQLRLVMRATNGADSARVYALRVYDE